MKVALTLSDDAGCGHYRAIYPGLAAHKKEGIEVKFVKGMPMRLTDDLKHVITFERPDCDVFVISRPLRRLNMESIPVLQGYGIAVVVDIDDDFSCVDPAHVSARRFEPKLNPESNRDHLRKACAMADLVTCTTPALAQRYASHGRVAVLPNKIPTSMLGSLPAQPKDGRTVGWPGFVATHPRDLEVTRGGVAMACREAGARFVNVGTGSKVVEQLELGEVPFAATGPVEFEDYPHAIAQLDVGVVPLADSAFNEAKSALKGLELAAVAVPFVASPTTDYQRIAADGIGLLAPGKAKKWRGAVTELLRDPEAIGIQMRNEVIAKHLLEPNAWRWVEAWEAAMKVNQPTSKGLVGRFS